MITERDYYEILDIDSDASRDDIRVAFRRLATILHPDRNHAPDANARFAELREAYETLRDPQRRARYDSGERNIDELDREALKALEGALDAVLDAGVTSGVIDALRRTIGNGLNDLKRQLRDHNSEIRRLTDATGTFVCETRRDRVSARIVKRIEDAQTDAADTAERIRIVSRALELAGEYRDSVEPDEIFFVRHRGSGTDFR